MKFYGYWRSTSSWRVRIALAYKGIEHEYISVQLLRDQQQIAEFRKKNPMAQIPVLEIEEAGKTHYLSQSMAILEYIEERFPEPALLPAEALLRARVRQLAEIVNSGIQPLQNLAVLRRVKSVAAAGEPSTWARHFIGSGLDALEAHARTTAGSYLVGDTVTLADVLLVPQLYNARRYDVDIQRHPTLLRVEHECEKLDAFRRAHASAQPDAETGSA